MQGGRIIGATDRLGESPKEQPLRPGDLHHTIYHILGVDPHMSFLDHSGRPVVAVVDHGAVIDGFILTVHILDLPSDVLNDASDMVTTR